MTADFARLVDEVEKVIAAGSETIQFGEAADMDLRILYGGSVTPDIIEALMREREIDGVLVGSASLEPRSFADIVTAA